MSAVVLALGACGNGDLAQRDYDAGADAARAQGCDCDPFLGDPNDAGALDDQVAPRSTQWLNGYVNTCVTLQRECRTQPADETTGQ